MPLVWRVEHPETGLGYYHHGEQFFDGSEDGFADYMKIKDDHDADMDNHPAPIFDDGFGGEGIRRNELSAFRDEEQLCEWFTDEELVLLMDLGFEIVQIPAENIRYGDKQVLFERVEHDMCRV